jgi:hypothetical protein
MCVCVDTRVRRSVLSNPLSEDELPPPAAPFLEGFEHGACRKAEGYGLEAM